MDALKRYERNWLCIYVVAVSYLYFCLNISTTQSLVLWSFFALFFFNKLVSRAAVVRCKKIILGIITILGERTA